jgi:heme-degrading monooxygenase HmoA
MIARMWHGMVLKEDAVKYHQYLKETGLPDYENTSGNRGVFLLKKDDAEVTHFYTLTFWNDVDSIKGFAGEAYEEARYYPMDREFLLELEPGVTHFDLLECRNI